MGKFFTWLRGFFRRHLLVNRCLCCGIRLQEGLSFCRPCRRDMESGLGRQCGICHRVLSSCQCPTPFLVKHRVRRLHKLLPYRRGDSDNGINRMILRLKKQNPKQVFEYCAESLGKSLAGKYSAENGWCVTFAPRSVKAKVRYGYDQSESLAKHLAKVLELPYEKTLTRQRKSKAQRGLSHDERKKNMRSAFRCGKDLGDKKYLLVDDVVTTGASLGNAAAVLYQSGAKRVVGVCLCIVIRS